MKTRALVLGILGLSLSARAQAHFDIQAPPPADTATDGGKGPPPCGPAATSNIVTPAQGGHALTLQINETVFHPGFYRVALAQNSPSELPADNVVKDKMGNVLAPDSIGLSDTAEYETTPVYPVLADHLFAHDTPDVSQFQTDLMLPNVSCDKCTLQVIEFMSNSNSNLGGGYFYHHCATLKITADPSLPAFTPPVSSGGASSGGASGVGGVAGASGAGGAFAAGGASNGGASGAPSVSGGTSGGLGSGAGAAGSSIAGAAASAAPSDSGGCSSNGQRPRPFALWFGSSSLLGLALLVRRRVRASASLALRSRIE